MILVYSNLQGGFIWNMLASSGVALKATWILHPGHILRQASPKHQSGSCQQLVSSKLIETQMF